MRDHSKIGKGESRLYPSCSVGLKTTDTTCYTRLAVVLGRTLNQALDMLIDDLKSTPKATTSGFSDKSYYDGEQEYSENALRAHVEKQSAYIDCYRKHLMNYFGSRSIRILELGAGTCALSLSLSKSLSVQHGAMFDISAKRMQQYAAKVGQILDLSDSNFQYLEGDFSAPSSLPAEKFDLILFDASLHHARSIWSLLAACRARLAPGGLLVAQREQHVARLTAGYKLNRLLATDEVRRGVSENAYLREQYLYYLRVGGFDVCAIPAPETALQKLCSALNGFLFSKWVYVARGSAELIGKELPLESIVSVHGDSVSVT